MHVRLNGSPRVKRWYDTLGLIDSCPFPCRVVTGGFAGGDEGSIMADAGPDALKWQLATDETFGGGRVEKLKLKHEPGLPLPTWMGLASWTS
jgi:hypothetical protein